MAKVVQPNGWQSGVGDLFIVCSDGLKGIGEAIEMVWPHATHQTCVVHLVRASLRYSNRRDRQHITPMLRDIYTAPTAFTCVFVPHVTVSPGGSAHGAGGPEDFPGDQRFVGRRSRRPGRGRAPDRCVGSTPQPQPRLLEG